MGRKLAFCKDDALRKVMHSFWARGYGNTSMRDLAAELNLHLGSLYNALGDKDRVFERALELHMQDHLLPQTEALHTADDPMAALENFLQSALDGCLPEAKNPGCFIFNSLHDIRHVSENVNRLIDAYLQKLEEGLAACIARAQVAGKIPQGGDPVSHSRFMIGAAFSIRTIACLKLPEQHLRAVRDGAMRALTA